MNHEKDPSSLGEHLQWKRSFVKAYLHLLKNADTSLKDKALIRWNGENTSQLKVNVVNRQGEGTP
jgi:hypothetical protein